MLVKHCLLTPLFSSKSLHPSVPLHEKWHQHPMSGISKLLGIFLNNITHKIMCAPLTPTELLRTLVMHLESIICSFIVCLILPISQQVHFSLIQPKLLPPNWRGRNRDLGKLDNLFKLIYLFYEEWKLGINWGQSPLGPSSLYYISVSCKSLVTPHTFRISFLSHGLSGMASSILECRY